MPLLDLFWAMLWFFLWVVWIWLLITVFIDIFRTDMSGWAKAGWVFFVIILPFLGVLVYVIVHGSDMQDRRVRDAEERQRMYAGYGSAATSTDELEKLAKLHDDGTLTDEEFAAQKAKILSS